MSSSIVPRGPQGDLVPAGEHLMTISVYQAGRDGYRSQKLVMAVVRSGEKFEPLYSFAYPPCRCPLHRG